MAAATIVLSVPTVITSFFGQNVTMPWNSDFAAQPGPFVGLLSGCILATAAAVFILKRKRML